MSPDMIKCLAFNAFIRSRTRKKSCVSNRRPELPRTASNRSFNVTIPIKITRRGRRKAVTLPDGTTLQPSLWRSEPTPIELALAQGQQWLAVFESGKTRNLAEVAEMEGMNLGLRQPPLTTLAPNIVRAILDDALPNHITLFDLAVDPPPAL